MAMPTSASGVFVLVYGWKETTGIPSIGTNPEFVNKQPRVPEFVNKQVRNTNGMNTLTFLCAKALHCRTNIGEVKMGSWLTS